MKRLALLLLCIPAPCLAAERSSFKPAVVHTDVRVGLVVIGRPACRQQQQTPAAPQTDPQTLAELKRIGDLQAQILAIQQQQLAVLQAMQSGGIKSPGVPIVIHPQVAPGPAAPPLYTPPGIADPPRYTPPGIADPPRYTPPGIADPPRYTPPGIVDPPRYTPPNIPAPVPYTPPGVAAPPKYAPPGYAPPTGYQTYTVYSLYRHTIYRKDNNAR